MFPADCDGGGSSVGAGNVAIQGLVKYGAAAIQPGTSEGKLETGLTRWRFKKNLPYLPAPLIYKVQHMVRNGGIVTSLDPATGRLLKEGRSRDAFGQYYASPAAAHD